MSVDNLVTKERMASELLKYMEELETRIAKAKAILNHSTNWQDIDAVALRKDLLDALEGK